MRHTGKGTCKGCKPGTTFQDTEGQKSCMDCAEDCDKGYERVQQCTSTSDEKCTPCPVGRFKASIGPQKCKDCEAGKFQGKAGMLRRQW